MKGKREKAAELSLLPTVVIMIHIIKHTIKIDDFYNNYKNQNGGHD